MNRSVVVKLMVAGVLVASAAYFGLGETVGGIFIVALVLFFAASYMLPLMDFWALPTSDKVRGVLFVLLVVVGGMLTLAFVATLFGGGGTGSQQECQRVVGPGGFVCE